MSNGLLSSITFGAFLAYSPRGQSSVSVQSRVVRDAIKYGNEEMLRRVIERLASEPVLERMFGPDVTLVPCPRSAPLVRPDAFWPGRLIAQAMVSRGIAKDVLTILQRIRAVPKSTFHPGERPTAQLHYETIAVEPLLLPPTRIVLVDDFVTKGNMLLAAVSRVQEACPCAAVSGFGLVRTLGLQPDIERIVDPCVGTISLLGDEGKRDP